MIQFECGFNQAGKPSLLLLCLLVCVRIHTAQTTAIKSSLYDNQNIHQPPDDNLKGNLESADDATLQVTHAITTTTIISSNNSRIRLDFTSNNDDVLVDNDYGQRGGETTLDEHVRSAMWASGGHQKRAQPSTYHRDIRQSAYVCEDKVLHLSCSVGKHIDVLRANFGRFSITLCNPSGFLDWSVNCASGNSLSVLTQRCSGRNNCSIQASSDNFEDPCPATSKYLEVHYRCSSALEINSNRSLTAGAVASSVTLTPLVPNSRKPSDNGRSNRIGFTSLASNPSKELISPENSLLTPNQSSIDSVLRKDSSISILAPNTSSLNQDLSLVSSSNTKCNQPDSSESNSSNHSDGLRSAQCRPQPAASGTVSHNSTGRQSYVPSDLHNLHPITRSHQQHQHQPHQSPPPSHKYLNSSNVESDNELIKQISSADSSQHHQQRQSESTTRISIGGDESSIIGHNSNSSSSRQHVQRSDHKQNNHNANGDNGHPKLNSITKSVQSKSDSRLNQNKTSLRHKSQEASPATSESTCQSIIYRDIEWPQTAKGSMAVRPCPHEASGLAKWKCGQHYSITNWEEHRRTDWNDHPDLSQCNSRWLLELYSFQNLNNFRNDMWKSILDSLRQATFFGGDIVELIKIFETSLQNFFIRTNNLAQQPTLFAHNLQHLTGFDTVFEIVSFLLSTENDAFWNDLPATERELTALNLMSTTMKYTALYCLDKRHFNSEKEVIKESQNLLISCYSISKLLHEFQLNWQARKNTSNEFKFKLFTSAYHRAPFSEVKVYMIVSGNNFQTILNENIFFGTMIPFNVERYFLLANVSRVESVARHPTELPVNHLRSHSVNLIRLATVNSPSTVSAFINSHVIKLFKFNYEQIINDATEANLYSFEMVFQHLLVSDLLQHQCVHWNALLNKWTPEQCTLVQSNVTHSICRCNIVSTCTVLASQHSTNHSNANLASMIDVLSTHGDSGSILSLALIAYMWIALLLTRCHVSFFNQFNFVPLLVACIMRTSIEVCIVSNIVWPDMLTGLCQSVVFVVIYQLQVISCLLAVFLFQNVILVMLANKIYLSKSYANSLHAINKSMQIQTATSFIFPIIHLALFYLMADKQFCWPRFGLIFQIDILFVMSHIFQIVIVLVTGLAFLHCSQKIFSDYDYPNVHCFHLHTALFEKYIKQLFCSRCKHSIVWAIAVCVYLLAVVGCLCWTFLAHSLEQGLIGIDIGLLLTFVLFWRLKYASNLISKCNQSTSKHCSSSKQLSSSACSVRDNSLSILSDSSKAFLTLPGQISLSKMLESPKIYPSSHRSSSIYGHNSNPSSHLYESPKHLYKYEYEHNLYGLNSSSTLNPSYSNHYSSNGHDIYPLKVKNHLSAAPMPSVLPSLHHNMTIDTNNINLSLRPNHPTNVYRPNLMLDGASLIFS